MSLGTSCGKQRAPTAARPALRLGGYRALSGQAIDIMFSHPTEKIQIFQRWRRELLDWNGLSG
jgi:hypothetical protein